MRNQQEGNQQDKQDTLERGGKQEIEFIRNGKRSKLLREDLEFAGMGLRLQAARLAALL